VFAFGLVLPLNAPSSIMSKKGPAALRAAGNSFLNGLCGLGLAQKIKILGLMQFLAATWAAFSQGFGNLICSAAASSDSLRISGNGSAGGIEKVTFAGFILQLRNPFTKRNRPSYDVGLTWTFAIEPKISCVLEKRKSLP
jgi:hypothetical protein